MSLTAAELAADEISRGGPIGFDRFTEIALYSDQGFFTTGRGPGGHGADFLTSVEVGPLFAELVARWLDRCWIELGAPDPFEVAEVGAGRGQLAVGLLAAEPECARALDLTLVERSPRLAELASVRIPGARIEKTLGGRSVHVVLANELLDNMGSAVAELTGSGWVECRVGLDGDRFRFVHAELDPADRATLGDLVPGGRPGARVPVARRAVHWVSSVDCRVLCVIDYGATTAGLAERGIDGWLRTYSGHGPGVGPLEAVGEQDVTTDVPFDQLPRPTEHKSQATWLSELGAEELVAEGRRVWAERAGVGDLVALRARSRVNEDRILRDPDGLGRFGVLLWRSPAG